MPELPMQVHISRSSLGLDYLEANDHTNYYVSNSDFMSGQVTYNRQTATSPFMDGAVTVFRNRQQVTQNMTIEVMGESYAELRQNIDILAQAFMQDSFALYIYISGYNAPFKYKAEAADYAIRHDGPRWIAHQIQMQFMVPCQPLPVAGVV